MTRPIDLTRYTERLTSSEMYPHIDEDAGFTAADYPICTTESEGEWFRYQIRYSYLDYANPFMVVQQDWNRREGFWNTVPMSVHRTFAQAQMKIRAETEAYLRESGQSERKPMT